MSDEEYEQPEEEYEEPQEEEEEEEQGYGNEEEENNEENEEEPEEEEQQAYEEPEPEEEEPEKEPEPEPEPTYTSNKSAPTGLDLDSAWEQICKDEYNINWYAARVNKKQQLEFDRAGTGGLKELTGFLNGKAADIYMALLRVNSNDKGGSKRAKFVFVRYVGSKVGVMQKAKLTPNLGRLSESFPVKHLTFDMSEEMQGFDQKSLTKEFLRVGGAHKPDSYEYGPSQIHKI